MTNLDNAATTRPSRAVLAAMARAPYGNPSSGHAAGREAKAAIERARAQVAAAVGAQPRSVVFTSGGTEADAIGILGPARARTGRHVVVSAIEHSAVLGAASILRERGYDVTTVFPDANGVVDPARFLAALRPDTAVASMMLANNEIGTVQPVGAVAAALRAAGSPTHLHADAVQAFGKVPLDFAALGADSMALSAHKVHGPKGAGALVVRDGAFLGALTGGGKQEAGLRPGTENVSAIVGFGVAAEACRACAWTPRAAVLCDRLAQYVTANVPYARVNGAGAPRVGCIVSISMPGLTSRDLLAGLEERGVLASSGSACRSANPEPSHVLRAIGVPDDWATVRISMCGDTTEGEVREAARAIVDVAAASRFT